MSLSEYCSGVIITFIYYSKNSGPSTYATIHLSCEPKHAVLSVTYSGLWDPNVLSDLLGDVITPLGAGSAQGSFISEYPNHLNQLLSMWRSNTGQYWAPPSLLKEMEATLETNFISIPCSSDPTFTASKLVTGECRTWDWRVNWELCFPTHSSLRQRVQSQHRCSLEP